MRGSTGNSLLGSRASGRGLTSPVQRVFRCGDTQAGEDRRLRPRKTRAMIAACSPTQIPAAVFTCGMRDNVRESLTTLFLVLPKFFQQYPL